jgi:hypothetical protein
MVIVIPIAQIRNVSPPTQKGVDMYVEKLEHGEELEPITVSQINNTTYLLRDGSHRIHALMKMKKITVLAVIQ